MIVSLLVNKLWCNIVHCSTESGSSLIDSVGRPAEVTKLYLHFLKVGYEYILRLYISMNNISILQIE